MEKSFTHVIMAETQVGALKLCSSTCMTSIKDLILCTGPQVNEETS